MRSRPFGESPHGPVTVLSIGSEPGPVLEVLDLGATVHRLWVTGGDGVRRNVVLGHATPAEYLDSKDYIGATVGRFANRIRDGRFELDGQVHQLETNDRGNTLHGGPEGLHRRLWEVVEHDEQRLVLAVTSPDGDQGFPGRLVARVELTATEDTVTISFGAETDAPTVVNLSTHAYFNLDGDGSGPIDGQRLSVLAPAYLPTDETQIPLEPRPVADTDFDLRQPPLLGEVVARTGGIDHDYVLDEGPGLRIAAVLDSPATGTRLELVTDQPDLQVYTGIGLDGTGRSTEGVPYEQRAGMALEPQRAPDTPNRPDLGPSVLRPGETYTARTEWRFSPLPRGTED